MSRCVQTRSITQMLNDTSPLLRLPPELLHEIVHSLDESKQGGVLQAFMGTSHRLRTFALPLFFKTMHLNKPRLFQQMISFLDDGPSEIYSYIRSIKIHISLKDITSFKSSSIAALQRFTRLRVFEASYVQCTQKVLDALPPTLQELEICWYGKREFPNIRAFKQLRAFRMITFNRRDERIIPRLYYAAPVVLPHLTTLSICLVSHACLSDIVNQYILPNLQVLKFEHAVARPRAIYQFIDRHPKLREVNVAFQSFGNPRLLPITLMMGGSDAWKPLSVDTMDTFTTRQKESPLVSWSDVLVQEMAFTRVPIENPSNPSISHSIRELALMTEDTAAWQLGSDFMNVMTLGSKVSLFRNVEILTVQAVDHWGNYSSFSSFMADLGSNLKQWPMLKKLTIHVHSSVSFTQWGEQFLREPPAEVQQFLDEDTPLRLCQAPISSWTGQPITIQTLLDSIPTMAASILAPPDMDLRALGTNLRRQVVDIAGQEYANVPYNKVFLAPAWERIHKNTFSAAVAHLATCCPTLEQFDWYMPVSKDIFSQGPRWACEIARDNKGGVEVDSEFIWRKRRPLYIVVGSELERIRYPTCFSR